MPRGQSLMSLANPVAISPDGRHVVFATYRQLYLRALDNLTASPVPGTENARSPFFSPDGQWIAFWTSGEIRKVSLEGGVPITICRARTLYGATWTEDGRILYSQKPLGIHEVSAEGGEPRAVLRPDPAKGELGFQSPQLLDRDERRAILDGGSDARYLPSGHLVFTRERALHVAAFDPETLSLRGAAVPVIDSVRRAQLWETGATQFSVSSSGTLVYVPAGADLGRKIVWVDRHGAEEELPMPIRFYVHPRLSPDGRRIVVDTVDTLDVWIYDLDRGTLRRLTAEQTDLHPVWSADGRRVIYDSTQGAGLHWTEVDGAATELIVRDPSHLLTAVSVTRDGKFLAFERSEDWVSFDLAVPPLSGSREPRPFLETQFKETSPMFSPDGQWLAYVSDETGTEEVYVQPYPGPGATTLISTGGGREPQWSPAGGKLFYRERNALMAVRVMTRPEFSASRPQQLFERAYAGEPIGAHPTYDVSADGQRFLFVKDVVPGEIPNRLHVVFGWFDDIRRQAVVSK